MLILLFSGQETTLPSPPAPELDRIMFISMGEYQGNSIILGDEQKNLVTLGDNQKNTISMSES